MLAASRYAFPAHLQVAVERFQQFDAGLLRVWPRQQARERMIRRPDLQRRARRRFRDHAHAAIGDRVPAHSLRARTRQDRASATPGGPSACQANSFRSTRCGARSFLHQSNIIVFLSEHPRSRGAAPPSNKSVNAHTSASTRSGLPLEALAPNAHISSSSAGNAAACFTRLCA